MRRPEWPGIATATAVLLILVLVMWLSILGPIWQSAWTATPDQWLGFAGAILGSAITSTVAVVAILFASRQLRIGIVSREEDRIERDLPGLRDAEDFLAVLTGNINEMTIPATITELLRAGGIGKGGTILVEDIIKRLPRTDSVTRRHLADVLFSLNIAAIQAKLAEQEWTQAIERTANLHMYAPAVHADLREQRDTTQIAFEQTSVELQRCIAELKAFHRSMLSRIAALTDRQPRLRAEIEKFFRD